MGLSIKGPAAGQAFGEVSAAWAAGKVSHMIRETQTSPLLGSSLERGLSVSLSLVFVIVVDMEIHV